MDSDHDGPVYDRAYLLQLLTEVRPDISLDDFRHYANLDDALLAFLLAEAQNEGEAAIYTDEWNAPIICLTPLGSSRAGVKLSASHPPIWLSVEGFEPPIIAVQEAGFVLFTDLERDPEESDSVSFVAAQVDPNQLESVEVLTNIEEFSEWLILDRTMQDGSKHPKRSEFCLAGMHDPWPLDQPRRATPETPSASTWQELYTRCPFCRSRKPGETCKVCLNNAPAKRCPACDGKKYSFHDLCNWCHRSGVDHILFPADVVQARRKHVPQPKPKKPRAKKVY